jgi:hypothetical protein
MKTCITALPVLPLRPKRTPRFEGNREAYSGYTADIPDQTITRLRTSRSARFMRSSRSLCDSFIACRTKHDASSGCTGWLLITQRRHYSCSSPVVIWLVVLPVVTWLVILLSFLEFRYH